MDNRRPEHLAVAQVEPLLQGISVPPGADNPKANAEFQECSRQLYHINENGETLLMIAVKNRHVSVAEQLLKRSKIDVTHKSVGGYTALELAIRNNDATTVELLCSYGALAFSKLNRTLNNRIKKAIQNGLISFKEHLVQHVLQSDFGMLGADVTRLLVEYVCEI